MALSVRALFKSNEDLRGMEWVVERHGYTESYVVVPFPIL